MLGEMELTFCRHQWAMNCRGARHLRDGTGKAVCRDRDGGFLRMRIPRVADRAGHCVTLLWLQHAVEKLPARLAGAAAEAMAAVGPESAFVGDASLIECRDQLERVVRVHIVVDHAVQNQRLAF